MRQSTVVVVLFTLAVTSALPMPAMGTQGDHEVGPREWTLGMSWHWENETSFQDVWVTDDTEMKTRHGSYDVWMTRSRRVAEDGTEYVTLTAWEKNTHRRVYDQVHIYRQGAESMTASTSYNPPAPFPVWGTITPGGQVSQKIHTVTEYSVGFQPAGREEHTWRWVAWGDEETYNLTMPAGTFEGFNVTIYREEINENDAEAGDDGSESKSQRFRYFYAPEAHHFGATFDSQNELDYQLQDLVLDPPPAGHAESEPAIPQVGETFTLDARKSYDENGNITTYEWTFPNGTTKTGEQVTARFDEPGRKRIQLHLVSDTHQETTLTFTVRVIERTPKFKIAGPSATAVEEGTSFRIVAPEDHELRRAKWQARNVEPRTGEQVELSFPQPGRYNLTVTYVDKQGNTGTLHHEVHVVEVRGAGNSTLDASEGRAVDALEPSIVSPANDTKITEKQVLVVARTVGLDDPALLLPNGLRVPLNAHGDIASAQVPIRAETSELRLVDGDTVVDRIVVHQSDEASVAGGANTTTTDTNDAPFPLVTFLLIIPLLRRRKR